MRVEKGICYIRVSTPKQKRQSPAKQWEYIKEYIEEKVWKSIHPKLKDVDIVLDDSIKAMVEDKVARKSFEAVGVFFEDESAWERGIPGKKKKKRQRSAFKAMLEYIKKNKPSHILTCWSNRLYRNTEDMIELKQTILGISNEGFLPYLHIVEEENVFSWSDSDDYVKFISHEASVVQGKRESYDKQKHAKRAKERAFKEGLISHRTVPGYRNVTIDGEARVEVDEDRAVLVRKMFKKYDEEDIGYRALNERMADLGLINPDTGRAYSTSMIKDYLHNKFYIGMIQHKGEWTKSTVHEGIIPEPLFNRVQKKMESRNRSKGKPGVEKKYKPSPLARIFTCHFCGKPITTGFTPYVLKTTGEEKHYYKLKCTSGHAHSRDKSKRDWYIKTSKKENWLEKYGKEATGNVCIQPQHNVEEIEKLMDDAIWNLYQDEGILEQYEEILTQDAEKERIEIEKEIQAMRSEQTKLKNEKNGYITMKAKELISDEEFIELKKRVDEKLANATKNLTMVEQNLDTYLENIEYVCQIMETLRNKWITLNQERKAEIFEIMVCQRELGNEKTGKLLIKWEKPWDVLAMIAEGKVGVPESFFEGTRRSRVRGHV